MKGAGREFVCRSQQRCCFRGTIVASGRAVEAVIRSVGSWDSWSHGSPSQIPPCGWRYTDISDTLHLLGSSAGCTTRQPVHYCLLPAGCSSYRSGRRSGGISPSSTRTVKRASSSSFSMNQVRSHHALEGLDVLYVHFSFSEIGIKNDPRFQRLHPVEHPPEHQSGEGCRLGFRPRSHSVLPMRPYRGGFDFKTSCYTFIDANPDFVHCAWGPMT